MKLGNLNVENGRSHAAARLLSRCLSRGRDMGCGSSKADPSGKKKGKKPKKLKRLDVDLPAIKVRFPYLPSFPPSFPIPS